DSVEDAELWETQQVLKAGLIDFVRRRVKAQYEARGEVDSLKRAETVLDLDVLTIGFCGRFATYKRANLILKDAEWLTGMVNSADRPIQLVFAGKAHPEDQYGK